LVNIVKQQRLIVIQEFNPSLKRGVFYLVVQIILLSL